jgi:hypothetical protein
MTRTATMIHSQMIALLRRLALALLLCAHGLAFAQADTPEARARLVDEYFTYTPLKKIIDDMAREIAKQVPEAERQQYIDTLTKNVRIDVLEAAAKQSLAKHLTISELKVFVQFMKQPEAQSAMDKMKFYMADLTPVMQRELARAIQVTNAPAKQ